MNEERKSSFVYGKRKSGKTLGVLFPEVEKAIKREDHIIMVDLKEEYYSQYKKRLQEEGYKVFVLNLKNPKQSNCYNPFALPYSFYPKKKEETVKLLKKMGEIIFKEERPDADPFWGCMSRDLFIGLSLLMMKEAKKEEINLGSISVAISSMNQEKGDLLKHYIDQMSACDPIYLMISGTIYSPLETKQSIIAVIRQKINSYCANPALLSLLSGVDSAPLEMEQKMAIFLIPSEEEKENNKIINLLIDQLYWQIREKKEKATFLLDNMDVLPTFSDLGTMINIGGDQIQIMIASRFKDFLETLEDHADRNLGEIIEVKENKKIKDGLEERISYPPFIDQELSYPTNQNTCLFWDAVSFLEKGKSPSNH